MFRCTGQRPNTSFLERHFSEYCDRRKSLRVGPSLQLPGLDHIFAAGDVMVHSSGEGNLVLNAELNANTVTKVGALI